MKTEKTKWLLNYMRIWLRTWRWWRKTQEDEGENKRCVKQSGSQTRSRGWTQPRSRSHILSISDWTCLWGWEHVRLGAVDPDGDLSAGGTKFLEESAISPDPQVLLCDLHLKRENKDQGGSHFTVILSKLTNPLFRGGRIAAYSTQIPRTRRGIQTKKQPRNCDHVVLNKRLWNKK